MKNIHPCLLLIAVLLVLFFISPGCKKDHKTKQANLSATIGEATFDVKNAKATLRYESLLSSKGQLTITGVDNINGLTLIIPVYTGEVRSYSIPAEATAVYTNQATGIPDTASSGTIQVLLHEDYTYTIPSQSYPINSSGETYSSELAGGTFSFISRGNVQVTNGVFAIVFNK